MCVCCGIADSLDAAAEPQQDGPVVLHPLQALQETPHSSSSTLKTIGTQICHYRKHEALQVAVGEE
jgi:hypothetical protein